MASPTYKRLGVDERRQQLLVAGSALFADHAFEEISMRQIADAASVSKTLLYTTSRRRLTFSRPPSPSMQASVSS